MPPSPARLSGIDAVMLDLDGTLVDTLGDFCAALHGMCADLGLTAGDALSPVVVESMVGKGSEHLIHSALARVLGIESGDHRGQAHPQLEALYPQAWQAYQQHYRRINGLHAQVYPGVQAALSHLNAAGMPLACLTNKPQAFALDLLTRKGLRESFAQVFGGDSFARKKPDPLPLLKTCEALGTQPSRTLMVGDSVNDAQAARAAGCPVVLVSYGYNHGQPIRSVSADGYIDSLRELA